MSDDETKTPDRAKAADETWLGLEDREGALPAPRGEFPAGASEADGFTRRTFLQLLGASAAAVGMTACRRPDEQILPYARRPDDISPGVPAHYATALSLGGYAVGLLVEAHEGRPTKVEGNPDHPASLGASTAFHQAALLQLYDPDRARTFLERGQPRAEREFKRALLARANAHQADGGAGLRLLLEPNASPLLDSLRRRVLQRFPAARLCTWAPAGSDAPAEGARLAYGRPLETLWDFEKADVIVSLDHDFADEGPLALRQARGFARRRVPDGPMNRLYQVEPTLTPTGTLADHRLRLRPDQLPAFALLLARELSALLGGLAGVEVPEPPPLPEQALRFARAAARDLAGRRGRCAVTAGPRLPAAVQALTYAMNEALAAVGSALAFSESALAAAQGAQDLPGLAADLRSGAAQTLVITAYNPAYSAPADLDFAALLEKVPHAFHLSLYADETARRCAWFAPALHPFESWGDSRSADGMESVVQPLIRPLWGGLTEVQVLSALLGEPDRSAYELVREHWRLSKPGQFELHWQRWLADGVLSAGTPPLRPALQPAGVTQALSSLPAPGGGLALHFLPSRQVYDGRFANVAWLQELPEPIVKLVWDNAALVSPATAKALGVKSGDVIRLTSEGRSLEAPVQVLAGQADDTLTLPLGYGRSSEAERLARGVGFDAYRLRTTRSTWFAAGAQAEPTGKTHELVFTQYHWRLEGRPIALETTPEKLRRDPQALEEHRGPLPELYPAPPADEGHRWAMAIDMSRCTGCSACVVACQAENNVPVVGKEQVRLGREMHWLRVDRYFVGGAEDPRTLNQPMACVHCERAPCEYVCPVNATVHSSEGLNEQVYNRCIGTRYCSNNCPYKVRRFNFLAYNARKSPTEQMAMNPQVTVRSRGVMEKCTYCVQRIERARIAARREGKEIGDGQVVTACAQACPTEAIVFGDLNDPDSRVARLHADPRRYEVLHEVGTRPRTGHLAVVRNPNPELG